MNLLVVYTKDVLTQSDAEHIYDSIRNKISLQYDILVLPTEYVDKIEFYTRDPLNISTVKEGILIKRNLKC